MEALEGSISAFHYGWEEGTYWIQVRSVCGAFNSAEGNQEQEGRMEGDSDQATHCMRFSDDVGTEKIARIAGSRVI